MSAEIAYMPATEIASRIRRRDLSPVEAVDVFLQRIDERDPAVNAYVTVIDNEARKAAKDAEGAVMSGRHLGPLHGVPVALKDLSDLKAGVRHTFGLKPLANFVPDDTSSQVRRLEDAGAIVLGKTNTPEMGHKGVTDNMLCGPTSTPFRIGKNAGGSSGGSSAAVAAGMAPFALGGDGGGSIRIPASFSGVYGFKPSYGRVGLATRPNGFFTHTPFIHAGPLTRTVDDAALMMSVIGGPDPRDPFSLPDDGVDYLRAPQRSIQGMRVAYSPRFDVFPVDGRVAAVVAEAVRAFEASGAAVEEARVGLSRSALELALIWRRLSGILSASFGDGLKRQGVDLLADHRGDIPPQFAEDIELGERITVLEHKRDDVVRTEVFDAIQDVFESYDLLVTPTLAVPPVDNAADGNTIGPSWINGEEVDPLIGWCLTFPMNYSGHPAASVPAGFTDDGLPIGMQIVGKRHADDAVLAASAAFERARPWHDSYMRLEEAGGQAPSQG